jgi:uncharacterized protein (TIGR03083 family)
MAAGSEASGALNNDSAWAALVTATVRAAEAAVDLLGRPQVAVAWDRPSVLPEMTVGALAAHLAQMLGAGAAWLDADPDRSLTASTPDEVYGLARLGDEGTDGAVASKIQAWSAAGATAGPEAVSAEASASLAVLSELLPGADSTRLIPSVMAEGRGMTLPDYLRSRCVEFLVHTDDLARSIGLPTPPPDPFAVSAAITVLVDLCRGRVGDLAVLRALAGRVTADPETLRAL